MGEKVQGIRSLNGRYKIDRGRLRIVWKWGSQKTFMYNPWAHTKGGGGLTEGGEVQRGGE